MKRIYLDHTATTPIDPDVVETMKASYLADFGNASSIHRFGQEARASLDTSRTEIAAVLGAHASEVVFTGSGTEADNTALAGIVLPALRTGRNHIITSRIEHHAVLESCRYLGTLGAEVTYLPVDGYGCVNPDDVTGAIRPSTALISVMHANNEVGSIQPVEEIAAIAAGRGIPFHTDAVQSFCKIPFSWESIPVSCAALSAHKLYGPKGIGALAVRRGVKIEPLIRGGAQEKGMRAGTENVPLAAGFAAAARKASAAAPKEHERLNQLRQWMTQRLQSSFDALIVNGHPTRSLPHIVNVSFDCRRLAVDGESLLFNMDLAGIAVTSGSACTSGSLKPSHVLLAMGRDPETAKATIRFSMGKSTTREDLDTAVDALLQIIRRIGVRRD